MSTLFKLILIACMALYSYNLHSEVVKVKKGIQPINPKSPKKSKTKKASENEADKQEHDCEKEKVLCQQ